MYNMMPAIREDSLGGRQDGVSAGSTSNKGDKHGKAHRVETVFNSLIRESREMRPGALRSAIVSESDKVAWFAPPDVTTHTIIEASLDDESNDPLRISRKVIKRRKKKPKPVKLDTPKFKPPPPVVEEPPEPEPVDLQVDKYFVLRGIRNRDYRDFLKILGGGGGIDFDIEGGYEDVAQRMATTARPKSRLSQGNRLTERLSQSKHRRNLMGVNDGYASCGSEVGSAMSQNTVTSSMIELRARVAAKRSRALRRLRGMMNIIKVWKLSVKKPIIQRFQKAVRRLYCGIRMAKHATRNRRYPVISNPRASKAIYRLMMLVRMKLRNT